MIKDKLAVFPYRLIRHEISHIGARFSRLFLNTEIGRGKIHLKTSRGGNRSQWIVEGEFYVMGLAPACNLTCLGESAGNTHVDTGKIDPFLLNELSELPLGAELLTGGQRRRRTGPQGFE